MRPYVCKQETFVKKLLILLTLLSFSAQAADKAFHVLGVRDGIYLGSGTLQSQTIGIPNLGFISKRTLSNGTITATTKAYLLSPADAQGQMMSGMVLGPILTALLEMPIAQATAQLQVVYTDSVNFKMIDMKTKTQAGVGFCAGGSCTFSAKVSNGLELNETWLATSNGFAISGSQNFSGLRSIYKAQMNASTTEK